MSYASAAGRIRHVFLRDLLLQARIGVYAHEHRGTQSIRVNVDMAVDEGPAGQPQPDDLRRVVDYEHVANVVRRIVASGHVKLVETLAERIAGSVLADARVLRVRVRVEKLEVFPDAASVGVEVEQARAELLGSTGNHPPSAHESQ